jgi:hypothetical protein
VEIGDLIGWSHDKNVTVIHHFTVITDIRNGEISYSGHTLNRRNNSFDMGTFEFADNSVVIFHIKDVIK